MTQPVNFRPQVSLAADRRTSSLSKPIPVLLLLIGFLLSGVASAQTTDTWIGGTGNWSNPSNWNNGVPTSTSNVVIGSGPSVVTLDIAGAQSDSLTINSGDSLTMPSATSLTVYGSTISNAGTFALDATSVGVYLNIGGNTTLSGGLTMSNNTNNYLFGYGQPSPGASLTNKSTIQGAGNIGYGNLGSGNTFTNQGTINANQSNPFTIYPGSGTFINTGTLEATNGATLALNSGSITNTGGAIHADPSSVVTLTSEIINGGTLTTSGTGTIQANCCLSYSTLNGVTVDGTFQLNNDNIGYLQGTITNNGSMQINSTDSEGTFLDVIGTVTLTGSGTLTMSNNANNAIMGYAQSTPASLTNQITIEGAGTIGAISAGNTFTNQGTVNANQTTPLILDSANGTVNNTGTLEATNGATLELENGTINNSGGTIHADPGSIVSLYTQTISGGTLTTSGTGKIEAVCCLGYSTLDGVTVDGNFQWNSNNIGYLQGTITNNGEMTFYSPSGTNVVLDVNGAVTLAGKGTLSSTNSNNSVMGYAQESGASLLNESTIEGTMTITASNGNTITNATHGTVYAEGPLTIAIGSSGVFTNNGTLKVKKGSSMSITGGGPGGGGTFANFSGTTLTGGKYLVDGTLEFDGADVVTNAASITLSGVTSLIMNQNGVNALGNFATNTKTGSFTVMSGAMVTTQATSGNFTNAGKVTVGAGSEFEITAPVNSVGVYTQTAGTTTVDGTLYATGQMTIEAGNLYGKGTITNSLVSSGSITAGDSATKPGVLSPATYTQNSGGSLTIPIGGTSVGTQYGQLAVAGGASLNGTLNLKLIDGFVPTVGDNFIILTGSAVSGMFSKVNGTTINGSEHFTVTYNSTNVTLTVDSGS